MPNKKGADWVKPKNWGAPKGSRNHEGPWAKHLRWALAEYSDDKVLRGFALQDIAMLVIGNALKGERDAIKEIGDRLDGRPAQALHVSSDDRKAVQDMTDEELLAILASRRGGTADEEEGEGESARVHPLYDA